ncbi:MAG: hypothetical protein JO250_13865 [Armatimonadetes bacterium]|nr:hypothetical protein [Armatimonadota bacterium]
MNDTNNHSVAGGWLGTYHYRGLLAGVPPVRFEAAFRVAAEGKFSGTILDDGGGCEARATGIQTGSQVAFTKVYVGRRRSYALPVEYEGALAGDGKTMRGTWRIGEARGVWEARRLWSEESRGEQEAAEEARGRAEELTAA